MTMSHPRPVPTRPSLPTLANARETRASGNQNLKRRGLATPKPNTKRYESLPKRYLDGTSKVVVRYSTRCFMGVTGRRPDCSRYKVPRKVLSQTNGCEVAAGLGDRLQETWAVLRASPGNRAESQKVSDWSKLPLGRMMAISDPIDFEICPRKRAVGF